MKKLSGIMILMPIMFRDAGIKSEGGLTPEQEKEAALKVVETKAKEVAQAEVKSANAKADAAEKEAKAATEKNAELEKQLKEQQTQLDKLSTKLNKPGFNGNGKSFNEVLKEGYTKGLEKYQEKGGNIEVELDVKAITTANFTNDTTGNTRVIGEYREAGINKTPKRDPFVRELAFNGGQITGDTVSWTEKVSETGVPIALAELEAYPEESTSYQQFSTSVKKIGGLMKVSEEKLQDVNWMMNEINQELVERHDLVVDAQLLSGDGTANKLKGVLAYATAFAAGSFAATIDNANRADVLRVAYNQVITNLFKPTAFVLHPTDVAKMELQKDANGQYIMPPFAAVDGTKIKGLPVIENTGVTEGDFLVGDFSKLGVFPKGGVTLEIGRDADDFSTDQVTVKLRERLAARIKGRDTGAFVKGTFSTAITALETI